MLRTIVTFFCRGWFSGIEWWVVCRRRRASLYRIQPDDTTRSARVCKHKELECLRGWWDLHCVGFAGGAPTPVGRGLTLRVEHRAREPNTGRGEIPTSWKRTLDEESRKTIVCRKSVEFEILRLQKNLWGKNGFVGVYTSMSSAWVEDVSHVGVNCRRCIKTDIWRLHLTIKSIPCVALWAVMMKCVDVTGKQDSKKLQSEKFVSKIKKCIFK